MDLQSTWSDLVELAAARKEALAGAKQVHVFDRTAEEILSWIQDKERDLTYSQYAQDLDSIDQLVRKHQALETEIKAIKVKVEYIQQEGEKLVKEFPDTEDHIEDKTEAVNSAWKDLQATVEKENHHLNQLDQLRSYFDEYHDWL